jgi:alpha-galactosidase
MPLLLMVLLMGCNQGKGVRVEGKNITVVFDEGLRSQVFAKFDSKELPLTEKGVAEFVTVAGAPVQDFVLKSHATTKIDDRVGTGTQHVIVGESPALSKQVTVRVFDDFPRLAIFQVQYTNIANDDLPIETWTNNHYSVAATESTPAFWSYQSGSYESRADWVLPLQPGFSQENYMGMNASDYGGGTPVVDVWRKDAGLGVGHLELVPKLVALPVNMPDSSSANVAVQFKMNKTLKPGESFSTFETFVAVHQRDYFQTLVDYRDVMIKKGVQFPTLGDAVYEPEWCAWGYQRDFTMDQVVNTLPKAKEVGYQWATLDDGWQTAEGDWYLHPQKFPRGDQDMIDFVKRIEAQGLKAKLWWSPLAVDPGTDLIKQHPDFVLLNADGSTQNISWWDSYYLCPAYPPVQEYTKNLVTKFFQTWGFKSLKIDGQHLNGAPPCYNPAHNHAYPEESVEKVPEFFKVIFETALSIYPDAVIQICPCGTAFTFFTMPYMNQSVSSDPESSWQIRLKGKTLKALMGRNAAYYGDHVELSDGGDDFASAVGIGAIIGTKFTWPIGAKKKSKVDLTPEREAIWKKWADVYHQKMLPKATYRGELYDLGFDKPETHAIQKNDAMYYAFYADNWNGNVELRGLEGRGYRVHDYVNNKDLGMVQGPTASLAVEFSKHLLLEVIPE